METKKTVCPLDCPDSCGIVATLDGEKIVKLDGDPEHPFTDGFLCKKVRSYHQRVQSDDRILFPQKRVGKKGEGQFEQISWNEAFEIMVSRFTEIQEKHGGEALLPYSYAGNMGKVNRWAGYPFFHKYGASQLWHTICSTAAGAGWSAHYGNHPSSPPEKVLDADLVIAWGISIKVSNIHFMPKVLEAKKRGAKLVVIDPYLNSTGKVADFYFPVKPGGDSALALGIMKNLLEQKKLDQNFIEKHTSGFDELKEYLQNLEMEKCLAESGLSREQVDQLTDLLIQHPKTFIRIGIGLTRNTQGAMSARTLACLSAAMGLFDGTPGKGALLSTGAFRAGTAPLAHPQLMEKPTRQINMIQLGHALTQIDPPIHGLFVYSSNPLSVAPDASRVRKGLLREDLFTVVHEQVMTPTALYADLLLPATTSFENEDFYTAFGHFYASHTQPVIAPKGEAKSNFELFQTLAKKMGYTDAAFDESVEGRINQLLKITAGVPESVQQNGLPPGTYLKFSDYENAGNYAAFQDHKFQFSIQNADPSVPKIPCVLAKTELDDVNLKSRFPFQMITPPNIDLLNSTFGERLKGQQATVMIHPDDAAKKGIQSGDLVEIFNSRGVHIRAADVTENTQPGLVVLEGIFWENPEDKTYGVNDLTSQQTTDLGGGATFHEARVDFRKAESGK